MSKKTTILAAVLILAILAGGCAAKKESKDIDINGLAQSILDNVEFKDQLTQVDDFTVGSLYGIEDGGIAAQCVYVSSGATAEEVAVFTCADADGTTVVKEAAEQRIADMQEGFADYIPEEMAKLKDPVLIVSGRYVILCIADDSDHARSVIDTYIQET